MQEGRPSFTAVYVAFARAVGTYDDVLSRACHDPVAEKLLPRALGATISAARNSPLRSLLFASLRASSFGMFDHLALRTRIIDDAVQQAVAAKKAAQLVVLGAGLDGRAHRLESLQNTVVFEVDHPSTQAMKRRNAAGLPLMARELRYAACDFQHVSIEGALSSVGFNPRLPTVWIWEGVTMYLEQAAMLHSVDAMARLSAPDSTLIATYVTPRAAPNVPRIIEGLSTGLMRALAEPIHTQITPEAMASAFATRGFAATSDVVPRHAAAGYGVSRGGLSWAVPSEHVIVARKCASAQAN